MSNVQFQGQISENIIQIAASVILIFYVILNRESICGDSFADFKVILNIQK